MGEFGTLLHFDGAAWKKVDAKINADLLSVFALSPFDAWAVGDTTVLHWNGETWKEFALPVDVKPKAVWAAGPKDVWITSAAKSYPYFHGALRWNGERFLLYPFPDDLANGARVWGSGANDVWFTLESEKTVVHFAGDVLQPVDPKIDQAWRWWAVFGTSASDVWLMDDSSSSRLLAHYDGTLWRAVRPDPSSSAPFVSWNAGWKSGNTTYLVGDEGVVVRFDGITWATELNEDFSAPTLRSVWGSNDRDVWAVGDKGTIVRRTTPTTE